MPPPRLRLPLGLAHRTSPLQRQEAMRLHVRPASTTTSSTGAAGNRKAITLTTDTGRVPWSQLSVREKATRTTQQSFNFGVVLLGVGLTVGVGYVLYVEVFSPSSKTAVFNQVVKRIRSDQQCIDLLVGSGFDSTSPSTRNTSLAEDEEAGKRAGEWTWGRNWNLFGGSRGSQIAAYGEGSWSRWARNRIIASNTEVDRVGTEHMHMHFYVSGPKGEGTVWVHMARRKGQGQQWEYETLALDMKGQQRLWLENRELDKKERMRGGKMFGVRWF